MASYQTCYRPMTQPEGPYHTITALLVVAAYHPYPPIVRPPDLSPGVRGNTGEEPILRPPDLTPGARGNSGQGPIDALPDLSPNARGECGEPSVMD